MDWFYNDLVVIFGFVIVIVTVNAIAGVFRSNQKQKTIREMLNAGQSLDADTIKALGMDRQNKGGEATGGAIMLAVAAAMVFLGYWLSVADNNPEVLYALGGAAAFPGFIGLALLLVGMFKKRK